MIDPIRTPEWYFKSYQFLCTFPGYELRWSSYLEGMYHHYELWYTDRKSHHRIGPEIVYANGKKEYHFGAMPLDMAIEHAQ
jgi:hypothetical protein